jgi:hypothetical protein
MNILFKGRLFFLSALLIKLLKLKSPDIRESDKVETVNILDVTHELAQRNNKTYVLKRLVYESRRGARGYKTWLMFSTL